MLNIFGSRICKAGIQCVCSGTVPAYTVSYLIMYNFYLRIRASVSLCDKLETGWEPLMCQTNSYCMIYLCTYLTFTCVVM
jgi:hypothetical protein